MTSSESNTGERNRRVRESACSHCTLVRSVIDAMNNDLETTGQNNIEMPQSLFDAFENHTGKKAFSMPNRIDENGRFVYQDELTGKEPTNELCDFCLHFLTRYVEALRYY